ncbi:uncharacterized protein LOC127794820 [Diospyros lotus]|uniref:uncharacterized protein LOC127794820 n=1 Tax=Diospyros lotus TaxID=55363 RepID=UPI002258976B|nr:uncharacterized protein LOC127794820 [Diospyros lotus]
MTTSSSTFSLIPVFNGEHYHIWVIKMKFYLRSQGLWHVVETDQDPPPLRENPTLAQIKAHGKEKLKKDKALTYILSGLTDGVFTSIMQLDSPKVVWDKIKETFEGNERVKAGKLLTLKREFELLKMKDDKLVKDYSARLMKLVNQIRLHELTSKLQAQEQSVSMRSDEATEGAFQANHKGKNSGNQQGKKPFKNNRGKAVGSSSAPPTKGNFAPCSHCKRTDHAEKDCFYKDKPPYHYKFCNKLGHTEKYCRAKKRQSQQQTQQHANVTEEDTNDDEHLFMASQALSSHELNTWLIDSGYTNHITKHLLIFTSIDRSVQLKVKLGNGEVV